MGMPPLGPQLKLVPSGALLNAESFVPAETAWYAMNWPKPRIGTGMFTSSYTPRGPDNPDGYACDWIRWCALEMGESSVPTADQYDPFFDPEANDWWLLLPKDNARIVVIDTLHDLTQLLSAYGWLHPLWDEVGRGIGPAYAPGIGAQQLDFTKLRLAGIDGVHLTREGQWRTRLTTPSLYGWDCESTCWLTWAFRASYCIRPAVRSTRLLLAAPQESAHVHA